MPIPRDSRHFRIEKLGSGVYAAIARADGYGLCNAGIVDLGGRTVVFDSMLTPMAGADLARAAERCTGRRPDWVVNSHWHGDHVWGSSAFGGACVVSSRKVRELLISRSREQFDECRREFPQELAEIQGPNSTVAPADRPILRAWFRGVLDSPKRLALIPPAITFEEELVLEGSRRSLHLLTYGGGHSPSDVFGYLPDERILFAGDLAMVGFHPSVSDGHPDSWMRILRRMQGLRPSQVLPGHGPMGPGSTLRVVARYLGDLDRIALRAVRQGLSAEEIGGVRMPDRYAEWRFSFMFPTNVLRAYQLERSRPKVPSRS